MAEIGTEMQLWMGPNGLDLPNSIKDAGEILPLAVELTARQQDQIVKAFEIQAYDMAAEYAWKKAMVKLRETVATLGMKFIGEMIGRDDVDDATLADSVITDYLAIELAEQLGIIGATAALKLRHANELINHYFSKDADGEIDYIDAFGIVKSSVQFVLGEQHIDISIQFSKFRERLLGEPLKIDDPQVIQIISSPPFYLRTILTVLLYATKNDQGARLEHAIANLNTLIPFIWKRIGDADRWHVGTAYRDTTSSGNTIAASGIKTALMKVSGFDYVPENLRSSTFIDAANQLLQVHYAFNNFYNEPAAIQKLSSLGSVIPRPALIRCMQAYLAVYLGNTFGVCNNAAPVAFDQLSKISSERWEYYFTRVIQTDDVVLNKFGKDQVARFSKLLDDNSLTDFDSLPRGNQGLYRAIVTNNHQQAYFLAKAMYSRFRNGKK